MMNKMLLLVPYILISTLTTSTFATTIHCDNIKWEWVDVGEVDTCDVKNNPNITSESAAFITGITYENKTNAVLGLMAFDVTIEYFPKNLHEKLNHLIGIDIRRSGLKEVHQEDLKPFKKLKFLNLLVNKILLLEEGLFDFNPALTFVSFQRNQIVQIHPQAFNNLENLRSLYLDQNNCTTGNMYAENKPSKAYGIIADAKILCLGIESENLVSSCCSQCQKQTTILQDNGDKLTKIIEDLDKFLNSYRSKRSVSASWGK